MPAELIQYVALATYPDDPNVWGLVCQEHPEAYRKQLGQAHATNAVNKHNRDFHAEPQVNLTALCQVLLAAIDPDPDDATRFQRNQGMAARFTALAAVSALTGLEGEAAIGQAETWAYAVPPITTHVAPF
jgi:hypothetical protein